jgi:hypothetical protein
MGITLKKKLLGGPNFFLPGPPNYLIRPRTKVKQQVFLFTQEVLVEIAEAVGAVLKIG